jgi:serine/threonine-protein kinase RsbT
MPPCPTVKKAMPAKSLNCDGKLEIKPDRTGVIETAIYSSLDIITARQRGRAEAHALGIDPANVISVAAAISEVARNILEHAKEGVILMDIVVLENRRGLRIIARDQGPGIPDITHAMQYGCSTERGLGVGLAGTKCLMDAFEINSSPGVGTTVTMIKWLPA